MWRVPYHTVLELLFYLYVCQAITVENGKYTDVYVVIKDNVAENEELLSNIQTYFTEASQTLFEATKHRLYFGQIKVILPKSWSSKPEYSTTPELVLSGAHIKISNGNKSTPYVQHTSICGKEGLFMQLTPEFFLTNGRTVWGTHANVIVHEWGHLRWGLFDEYPTLKNPDNSNTRVKFYNADGKWNPVRCTAKVQGTIGLGDYCVVPSACDTNDSTKALNQACKFCPDANQDVEASLMAYQYIDKVSSFCDADDTTTDENVRHNSKAPNYQNIYCNYKSAWEVMLEHEDLKEGVNQALSSDFNTTPEFIFLQETTSYRVFVLDYSGSMAGSRIETLYETGKYIIQDVLADGSMLGIVWFSTTASLRQGMTKINSQSDRDILIDNLPSSTGGGTCIPCGIIEAISVLKSSLSNPQNGQIIVISDGENNVGDLTEAIDSAVSEQVIVHTIAVSQAADLNLEMIATKTGGTYYTYLEHGQISLADAISEVITSAGVTNTMKPFTILSEKKESTQEATFTFLIDEGAGNDTIISIIIDVTADIDVEITGDGYSLEKSSVSSKSLSIRTSLKTGGYNCSVILSITTSIQVYVKSSPNTVGNSVVEVQSRMSSKSMDMSTGDLPVVYALVSISSVPVIHADVQAIVDTGSSSCTIDLVDNGIDPDIESEDGVYCGYVPLTCINNGRLNVKVYANANTSASLGSNAMKSTSNIETTDTTGGSPVSSFQRISLPGVIYISNYVYNSNDVTSPGRITDLQVNDVSSESQTGDGKRNYTILWTATGNDKNIGQAVSYEMRISESFENMVNNFDQSTLIEFNNESLTPKIAGELEQLTVTIDAIDEYTASAFFAIIALDGAGNRGAVSNIISISVASSYTVIADVFVSFGSTINSDIESPTSTISGIDESSTALVIGIAVALSVVILVVLVMLVYWKLKPRGIDIEDVESPYRQGAEPSSVIGPSKTVFNVSIIENPYIRTLEPFSAVGPSNIKFNEQNKDDQYRPTSDPVSIVVYSKTVLNESTIDYPNRRTAEPLSVEFHSKTIAGESEIETPSLLETEPLIIEVGPYEAVFNEPNIEDPYRTTTQSLKDGTGQSKKVLNVSNTESQFQQTITPLGVVGAYKTVFNVSNLKSHKQ